MSPSTRMRPMWSPEWRGMREIVVAPVKARLLL